MTRVEQAVRRIYGALKEKDVLEVAYGCAEFSLCAASIARKVCCIDLDSSRMKFDPSACSNLEFKIMDATCMEYTPHSFDAVVLYNAVGHLEDILEQVLGECRRVAKKDGMIYIISSFKMDKWVIHEKLLPLEKDRVALEDDGQFLYAMIPV